MSGDTSAQRAEKRQVRPALAYLLGLVVLGVILLGMSFGNFWALVTAGFALIGLGVFAILSILRFGLSYWSE